jgi:peroxiredoxin
MMTASRQSETAEHDVAPDAVLTDTEGVSRSLSDFWTRQPVVLVFLRHFGCTFCREQVALLRRDYGRFQALGVEVICIAQGDVKTGKAFSIFFDLPFPLLMAGNDISVFHAYGLERGTLRQLFGLRSWTRGVLATLHGHLIGRLVGDGTQMPGVFLIDRSGSIRYAHRHRDAADNPETQVLLRAAQSLIEREN